MIKNYFRILIKPHAYLQAILKALVKIQKDRPKTVGGVKGTRYLLPIDFCNIRTQKMSVKNVIKNYFRILKKPHADLQTILKIPVKFQKDQTKTVGGVKGTKYLLKIRNHAPRKTKNSVPPLFFKKAGDNKKMFILIPCLSFVFYVLVNTMETCREWSVYLTTH